MKKSCTSYPIILFSLSLLTYTALVMATICSGLIFSSKVAPFFLPGNVNLGDFKAFVYLSRISRCVTVCPVLQPSELYKVSRAFFSDVWKRQFEM